MEAAGSLSMMNEQTIEMSSFNMKNKCLIPEKLCDVSAYIYIVSTLLVFIAKIMAGLAELAVMFARFTRQAFMVLSCIFALFLGKKNTKNSGRLCLRQLPQVAHTLRSDQNLP